MGFLLNEGIMKGEQAPDYDSCIKIATLSALLEMLTPGLIAIIAPIVVGLLMGPVGLAGMLAGALTSGFMLAVTMSNAGGAWDNAKKFVEKDGLSQYYDDGKDRAKKSENHKAVVVGDTVGDPFKDTSGPALNILIKLMSIVSLVLAPVFRNLNEPKGFDSPGDLEDNYKGSVYAIVILVIAIIAIIVITFVIYTWMAKVAGEVEEKSAAHRAETARAAAAAAEAEAEAATEADAEADAEGVAAAVEEEAVDAADVEVKEDAGDDAADETAES